MPVLWTIRRETFEVLARGGRERFIKGALARLSQEHAALALQLRPRGFRQAVERGVAAAAALDIETEADVSAFLDLWLRSEEDIGGRWPWSDAILRNTSLTARARLELIRKWMA